jgi:hypothetical protein
MNPATMPLSERVYFLGEPAAHVVAREERMRLDRIDRECRRLLRAMPRFPFVGSASV